MTSTSLFTLVNGIINVLAIIANAFGIRWLYKSGKLRTNQMKIIGNISCADILISTLSVSMIALHFTGTHSFYTDMNLYLWLVKSSLYIAWFFMFYLLMLERFLGCCFPLWYLGNASPNWTRNSLCMCWCVFTILSPTLCVIEPLKMRHFINSFLWIILDVAFIGLFVVLYSAIFFAKRRSTARAGRTIAGDRNKRFFGVTSAMLIAFLLLETVPTSITSMSFIKGRKNAETYTLYFEVVWSLNLLADPLIYIFMRPNACRGFCVCIFENKNRLVHPMRHKPTETTV